MKTVKVKTARSTTYLIKNPHEVDGLKNQNGKQINSQHFKCQIEYLVVVCTCI